MKKLIFILAAVIVPALLLAQGTPLSSLYDRYEKDPGFETSEILPGSMSFEWEKETDMTAVKELMQNIESIRIVKYRPEETSGDQEKIWKKMMKAASDDQYTEVMSVNADDVRVYMVMIRSSEGRTREVALLEKDDKGIMLMTMTGNMDFSAIFSAENMQNLREMGKYLMDHKGSCNNDQN